VAFFRKQTSLLKMIA